MSYFSNLAISEPNARYSQPLRPALPCPVEGCTKTTLFEGHDKCLEHHWQDLAIILSELKAGNYKFAWPQRNWVNVKEMEGFGWVKRVADSKYEPTEEGLAWLDEQAKGRN
jgi:hypothetical protein